MAGSFIKYLDLGRKVRRRRLEYNEAFNRVLVHGNFILGEEVQQFENMFAGYLQVRNVIGVANGLEALQIALMALNIGVGDEVITTPLSAVATTLAIQAVGATPVFVDTTNKGLITPAAIYNAITEKTKAVIPVHLYGQPCYIESISKLCEESRIYLIEDACQAHGSTSNGKKLGTFGTIGAFSFYPTKNIGGLGDGGALVTDNDQLAAQIRMIRDYGQSDKYVHMVKGLNSRLDELQAAFLKIDLLRLDDDIKKRRELAERYRHNLFRTSGVRIITDCDTSNYHIFAIAVDKREELIEHLKKNLMGSAVHYPTIIPDQPYMDGWVRGGDFKNARLLAKQTLSLPCHEFLTLHEVDLITGAIIDFVY